MQIGVPKEVKQDEYRVGMIPAGVEELTRAGEHARPLGLDVGWGVERGRILVHYATARCCA